jgi:hypothetical protein
VAQYFDQVPYTLAQLARRAGISEGRARGLYATAPSGLPRPDRTDADGRPLWWASTIDAWCARTGREVNEESLWVFRAPAAAGPAPELQRRVVTLGTSWRRQVFYAIVWDTEHGHVIYLQPLDGAGSQHPDGLAEGAAQLIEPRWWADAVIVIPFEASLTHLDDDLPPIAYVYRLTTRPDQDQQEGDAVPAGGGVFGGLRRRWVSLAAAQPAGPVRARATWVGQMDLDKVASVVGRPVPVWLEGTATTANAEQTLSYDRTFTTADRVTEWPTAQARLTAAIEVGMPGEYPAGFAALAVSAAEGLAEIRTAHEQTPDSGPGWYLVCRPARPAPPFELEQLITGADLVTDLDLVGKELAELRAVEGELDVDDPRGDIYAEAITLLEWQLRDAARKAGRIRHMRHDYVPVVDDGLQRYSSPWGGPVVEAWRKTLTPVQDVAAALRLRRVHRLADDHQVEDVEALYRDVEGRYVLLIRASRGELWLSAEWPTNLQATSSWTDKTVLAGDDDEGTTTTLLALTPTEDGQMRIDPVPLLPRSDRKAFAYGYGGGTPVTTYQALMRCALGDGPIDMGPIADLLAERGPDGKSVSQLWATITTTKGPLRLSWPQLKLWARADKNRATAPANS